MSFINFLTPVGYSIIQKVPRISKGTVGLVLRKKPIKDCDYSVVPVYPVRHEWYKQFTLHGTSLSSRIRDLGKPVFSKHDECRQVLIQVYKYLVRFLGGVLGKERL